MIWSPAGAPTQATAHAAAPAPQATSPSIDLGPALIAHAASLEAFERLLAPALAARGHVDARVRSGDTLQSVLDRSGVAPNEAGAALLAMNDVFDARTLQAGQDVRVFIEHDGAAGASLAGFAFEPDVDRTIHVARGADGGYDARALATPLTRRFARAQGAITQSLYVDAKAAGVDDLVIVEIANLLAYTVDFQREIRAGDEFEIVFDQFLNPAGEVVRTGDVHFVRFTPRGRELAFWRHTPPGESHAGFYDANGESARRFLMKTPVNGARLSSHFGNRRHPILGYTRMHRGTDFAAPRGTPIFAAGDGVIERANVYGGYGNYIRIRHANGYKTAYAHLNGFARGIRAGAADEQGQIIGYVGTTGSSTGPHLHYEVHHNGVAVNPMTIEAPTGRALADAELEGFQATRARIEALRSTAVPADSRPGSLMRPLLTASGGEEHAALLTPLPTEG